MAKDNKVLAYIIFGIILLWAFIIDPFIKWFKQNVIIASIITIIIIGVLVFLIRMYLQRKKIKDSEIELRRKDEIRLQHKKELEPLTDEERNILVEKIYREKYPETSIFSKLLELINPKETKKGGKPPRVPIPADVKKKVFQRAGYKCQLCGKSVHPEIHHINRDRSNNNPGNLIVLCPTHHAEADGGSIPKERLYEARDNQALAGRTEYR
jgi:5-methylcytosine-specific restriction endonuclease McrA